MTVRSWAAAEGRNIAAGDANVMGCLFLSVMRELLVTKFDIR